ncbi:fumarylacetoacetate hydrolase family protein [Actinomycetospora sp. CA-084318]|uniref:fumarylacetoacetate hydrolase family protein n=1 Tax=Actinomycetospora sp. CA-084318 TaxID=3239892 RepID=UPI003D999D0D
MTAVKQTTYSGRDVPRSAKVICCGRNYRAHVAELGNELPAHPTLFTKFADSLTGAGDDVVITPAIEQAGLDWEAELAVVVGTPLPRHATPEQARQAVGGYTVANDLSVRGWQWRTTQWLPGKALDASTPVGPVLVSGLDPAEGLALTCHVNGELVQSGSTDDLVFDVPTLLAAISEFTTLAPGDLVLTGTPGGVGAAMDPPRFLHDGDVVECAIEGIGSTRTTIHVKEAA